MITRKILQDALLQQKVKVNIILIDKNAHFEFLCTMYKYLTEENKFEKISKPIDKDFIASIVPNGYDQDVVTFIQGSLTKVSERDKTVTLTKPDLSELKINFDALVLCTGVEY